jgi:tetratricopeptide (TPR) repeat protein
MVFIVLSVVIAGAGLGITGFFVIRSILYPKRLSTIADLVKQKKTGQATRIAKQILAKEPRNFEAHYLLGLAYLAENKPELALMELKTVNQIGQFSRLCPENGFRSTIADLYHRFNQPEEALKEYLLLIKSNPTTGEYYHKAGVLFEERDKSDRAINFYRKAIELDPRHSDSHFRLGLILYRNKKPIESKGEFEIALKTNPNNYKAHFYLGRILKDNHDYVAALVALEKAQRNPEFKTRALVERGSCYMSMNSFDKAITELQRAIKLSEDDGAAETLFGRYLLALCYEKKREIDHAIEQWEKIYNKKPAFRDVAEKLSQYQDLRTDDRMKDYLTASMSEFYEICKALAMNMELTVQDINDIPNGCQIIGVETDSKWRNARKMPKIIWFLRVPEMITESTIRSLHEVMKRSNIARGIIFSSSNFSRKAIDFAETRPIDLVNQEQLQNILQSIDLNAMQKA